MQPHEIHELKENLPYLLAGAISSAVLLLLFSARRGLGRRLRPAGGPREPPLWGPGDVLLGVVAWIGLQLAAAPLLPSLGTTGADSLPDPRGQTLLQALTWLLTCGFVFLLVRRGPGQPLSTLGLRSPRWWSSVGFTLLVFTLSIYPIAAVMALWVVALHDLAGLDIAPQDSVALFRSIAENDDIGAVAILLVGGVIIAPVGEEIFFRGFIFGCFRERLGPLLGAVLSSFFFALLHLSLVAFAPLFLIGCILCYILHRTESIYPAMLFHAIFNASTFWKLLGRPDE
ncbi:MAG TPA: CPBP family glutamic-type intramembrane protease [Planctomycetota bacterium]|nr:CPBP family glutamic-type intramembrane protease [Planctomycetota bacterium]